MCASRIEYFAFGAMVHMTAMHTSIKRENLLCVGTLQAA